VLRWAADMAAAWKGCTKKLSAISCQLSVGSKAPLARAGPFCLLTEDVLSSSCRLRRVLPVTCKELAALARPKQLLQRRFGVGVGAENRIDQPRESNLPKTGAGPVQIWTEGYRRAGGRGCLWSSALSVLCRLCHRLPVSGPTTTSHQHQFPTDQACRLLQWLR
jgi:hypothetical protein